MVDLLHVNKSLSVLDVHNNPDLDRTVFESIMNLLATNNLGKPSEVGFANNIVPPKKKTIKNTTIHEGIFSLPQYHWIREDTLYLPRKPSYESRDPSFSHGPKSLDVLSLEYRSTTDKAVRQTKSNIISTTRKSLEYINKQVL